MTAIDVAYESHGPADLATVVLTGSLGTTTQMWHPQVAALSHDYRVVAYDTRGHGRSPGTTRSVRRGRPGRRS
jgi:3-oxoadipate enol-lactonase